MIPISPNDELVAIARRLDSARAAARVGSLYRWELATTLVRVHRTLQQRINAAPLDAHGLPRLSGISWRRFSPNAGLIEDIDPFGMIDLWRAEAARRPEVARPWPQRRHRQPAPTRRAAVPFPVDHPPRDTGPSQSRRVGEDVGRSLAPFGNRSTTPADGFVGELVPPEVGVVIDGIMTLVGELLPFTGFVWSTINTILGTFDALDSAKKTHAREALALGVRLGIHTLALLTLSDLRRESQQRFEAMLQLARATDDWTRMLGVVSNLDRTKVRELMFQGVRTIATAYRQAFEANRSRVRRAYSGPLSTEMTDEIRVQVRDGLVDAFREQHERELAFSR